MANTGIILADGARARFITVEEPDALDQQGGPQLVEHADLINPEGDLQERELFSDRGGRLHARPGTSHGSDDHRARHVAELGRRFARRVVGAAQEFAIGHGVGRIVLVAEPQLLGVLRDELDHAPVRDVEFLELAEDLSRRSLSDIRDILTRHALLPSARAPQAGVFHPRGQAPSSR